MAALVASKAQLPVWTPAPAKPGEKLYPSIGIRSNPAPPFLVPPVSEQQAAADTAVADYSRQFGTPDVELRLITNGDLSPGRSVENSLADRPAWVFTFQGTRPMPRSSPHLPQAPRPVPVDVPCEFTVIIDATTATMLINLLSCGG